MFNHHRLRQTAFYSLGLELTHSIQTALTPSHEYNESIVLDCLNNLIDDKFETFPGFAGTTSTERYLKIRYEKDADQRFIKLKLSTFFYFAFRLIQLYRNYCCENNTRCIFVNVRHYLYDLAHVFRRTDPYFIVGIELIYKLLDHARQLRKQAPKVVPVWSTITFDHCFASNAVNEVCHEHFGASTDSAALFKYDNGEPERGHPDDLPVTYSTIKGFCDRLIDTITTEQFVTGGYKCGVHFDYYKTRGYIRRFEPRFVKLRRSENRDGWLQKRRNLGGINERGDVVVDNVGVRLSKVPQTVYDGDNGEHDDIHDY